MTTLMEIRLRYFAALREMIGIDSETFTLPDGATIADVRTALIARHPAVEVVLARCVVARNHAFAAEETPLAANDEVVFIPPMAGG
jgi:molybdopterin converting factor subunit 1